MSKPRRFTAKPVVVEAMDFTRFSDVYAIAAWCTKQGVGVYGVPEGYEHNLRTESEWEEIADARASSHYAPAFLVLVTDEGTARLDLGGHVVRDAAGHFTGMTHPDFTAAYDPTGEDTPA